MTAGYGVSPGELDAHAEAVRQTVNAKVAAAHEAAQYEPGLVEMGILGFVITQVIDLKNDTDRLIMLANEFGNDLVDRVDHGAQTYRDLEEDNIELLNEIDRMIARQEAEQNPRGPGGRGPSPRPTDRPTTEPDDQPSERPDDQSGDQPGNQPGNQPGDQPGNDDQGHGEQDNQPPDRDSDPPVADRPGRFTAEGVRIRTHPEDGTIIGLGYGEHDITVHTDETMPGYPGWVRVTDNTTGRSGWSYGDYVAWDDDRGEPDDPDDTGSGGN